MVNWYDPTVGSPLTTNVPADPDPHWEARGFGVIEGGVQEITDFSIAGTAGTTVTTRTPSNQQVDFDLSGTIGSRELTQPIQPEITDFTLTGTTAECAGRSEIWGFNFTGSSDATVAGGTPEEFFIHLDGNSATDSPVEYEASFLITRGTDPDSITGIQWVPILEPPSPLVVGQALWENQVNITIRGASTAERLELFNGLNTGNAQPTSGSVTNTNNYRIMMHRARFTNSWGICEFNSVSGLGSDDAGEDIVYSGNFSVVANEPGGITSGARAVQLSYVDSDTDTFPIPSNVQITIPEIGIDETFGLSRNIMTSTALRDELFNRIVDTFGTPVTFANTYPLVTTTPLPAAPYFLFQSTNWPTTRNAQFNIRVPQSNTDAVAELGTVNNDDLLEFLDGDTVLFSTRVQLAGFFPNSSPVGLIIRTTNIISGAGDALPADGTEITIRRTPVTDNSGISNEYTITQGTATMADHGVMDGEPILLFTANNGADHSVGVSFTSGTGGDLSSSSFASVVEGESAGVSTAIRITYDSGITPSFQDIVFGQANDSDALAQIFAAMVGTSEDLNIITDPNIVRDVLVETVAQANFSQPVITVTERGTSDDFSVTVDTVREGVVSQGGTPSLYSIFLAGSAIASGVFTSNAASTVAAETIRQAIDDLTTHTATVSGSVVTATSVNNSSDPLVVEVSPGANDPGATSPNDIAVTRMVTQVGSQVEVFTGEDAMVAARVGTDILTTVNGAGMTLEQIATAIRAAYTTDARYTATGTGTTISLLATFTGMDNSPALDVTPGVLSDGTAATLVAVETILNNGENVTVIGETTQLTVTIGDASMTVDLTSGANAVDAANQLVTLINMFQLYSAVVSSGSIVTASSIRAEVTEDIVVTVSRIGTAGTIQVLRTQQQDGVDPTVNFSTTVWTYYTINQEVRVDDDTTAMMPDNTITIPRGLVVDSGNITASSTTGTATAAETYTTGSARSNLVITGGVSEFVSLTSTGTNTHVHTMEYSIDGGMTWIEFFVTQAFDPNAGAAFNGQAFNNVQFIGAQINDIPATTTVMFRGRDTGTAATGPWGFGILVIEERNADMTTM